jgi:hypothetical protein
VAGFLVTTVLSGTDKFILHVTVNPLKQNSKLQTQLTSDPSLAAAIEP